MRAIIIAAGSSTRLGRHAENLPKGMLDINGRTILQRQIELLSERNISDIVIIVGPHREKFNLENVRYVEDREHEHHDVLLSLMAAGSEITGDVIITYSDILYDGAVLDLMLESDADIGIATDLDWEKKYESRTEHPRSEADNVVIKDGRAVRIAKNISEIKGDQKNGEFIGMVRLSPSGSDTLVREFERVRSSRPDSFHNAETFEKSYLTDMMQELIDRGVLVTPVITSDSWCEIDTHQDLENARRMFR